METVRFTMRVDESGSVDRCSGIRPLNENARFLDKIGFPLWDAQPDPIPVRDKLELGIRRKVELLAQDLGGDHATRLVDGSYHGKMVFSEVFRVNPESLVQERDLNGVEGRG